MLNKKVLIIYDGAGNLVHVEREKKKLQLKSNNKIKQFSNTKYKTKQSFIYIERKLLEIR